MKYENAKEILPMEILTLVQQYAAGKLLYVPIQEESKSWGEVSGYRKKLLKRNQMICNKYRKGSTISELADEYFLSLDSIKKILYCKKDKSLEFTPYLSSALSYANHGMLEEWIETYQMNLVSGDNIHRLIQGDYISFGIVKIPLRLITQTVMIPKSDDTISFDKIYNHSKNNKMGKVDETEPLIATYEDKKFYVAYQKDIFHQLIIDKINAYPAIIVIQNIEEYKVFMKTFGRHFVVLSSSE